MAVDNRAMQRRLKDGVEAIKSGNRVRGRDLLLRVVQQDRNMEEVWQWLYQAVDEPHEKMRALENVLRLDPQNSEANQALVGLRQTQIAAGSPNSDEWASLLPEVTLEPDDDLDDPYQCPYCGRSTGLDDRKCPHCRGGLYARVARSGASSSSRLVLLLLGISLALGVIELLGPAFALGVSQGTVSADVFHLLLSVPGVQIFVGDFLRLSAPVATVLLQVYLLRTALLVAISLSLRERWSLPFYAALIGVFGDLLLSAYLLITGYLGVGGALLNGLLALVIGTLLFGLSDEFAVNVERVLVKPDGAARGAVDFYKRGHHYRQRRMWAMAVAQWRRAVGLAPQVPQYYKHLGIGYAQIHRFERSLRTLKEGQRQAPNDQEIVEIIALVQSTAEAQTLLKR
jgi:tetratricopeptide (TPR) repeat protein